VWDEVRARKKEKIVPFVTFAERYGREKAFEDSLEAILEQRFPNAVQTLMSRVRSVNDGDRLQKLVRLAVKASLSEIEAELPKE
jgi:hypothetical protein